ncbi:glycosyltransferase [Candidatus Microgenomates bacterium]|nr:glycosyltransferase [Candidatus Microgenomates bacterium]
MKTAVVYDWIDKSGGVERVLPVFAEMFPDADFYTSYYNPDTTPWAKHLKIKTSFIQKFPPGARASRIISLPFYKYAFESFDFTGYDLVISVTSSFAKGVLTKPETKHVCYLLTPTRYVWGQTADYVNPWLRFLVQPTITKLRKWDFIAAQRPNKLIAISELVARRAATYYRRDAPVIYPPFDLSRWDTLRTDNADRDLPIHDVGYYLFVGRLEPYKRIDLLINVFNKLHYPLIIVGSGSQEFLLKRQAHENIVFISNISDQKLVEYYEKARALIMPQEEEFGYTAIEAQYVGTPVISYRQSGVAETIIEGKTGIFFENQTPADLYNAIARFEKIEYNIKSLSRKSGLEQVKRFEKQKFIKAFHNAIDT